MPSPSVSVVMPVYNGERYLTEAVESILRQTMTDFEFIIVDDGSIDRTPELLSQLNDKRLRICRIEHVGLIGALNHGMELARAPYVARMDADDRSLPQRLERQAAWLDAHLETSVATCGVSLIDEAGRAIGTQPQFDAAAMLTELAVSNPVVHGSVMMRRADLPTPVYRQPPEDYVLWIQLAQAGRQFALLDEHLYEFRSHADRYSIKAAVSQSTAIVDAQRPLLEELTRHADRSSAATLSRLVKGWGLLAAAAYRSGRLEVAQHAAGQFVQLSQCSESPAVEAAFDHGVEAMLWGGCPPSLAWKLRLRQLRRQPFAVRSYRQLAILLREQWRSTRPPA